MFHSVTCRSSRPDDVATPIFTGEFTLQENARRGFLHRSCTMASRKKFTCVRFHPQRHRHLHSLLDLKELQMLAIAVRKISGADEDEKKAAAAANAIAQQQQEQRQQHGVRGRGRGSRRQEERGLSEGSAAGSGGVLGGANRNQSTFAMSAEPGGSRGSSSGEIMPREAGESSGSFEETNDGVLGALTGLGSAPFMAVDGARQADAYEAEDVLRSGRQAMSVGKTRGGSFRALLGSLPSSRKKAPSKARCVCVCI